MCEHKCGGKCCKRFTLPEGPEKLREIFMDWKAWSKGQEHGTIKKGEQSTRRLRIIEDIEIIYPMVVYLGEFNWTPARPRKKLHYKVHHYSCKHLDRKTGECTIYEFRPRMCVDYPYGEKCEYPGCGFKG